MMLLIPALAFALPFALPQPSQARPLTAETPQVAWCWGDSCEDDHQEDEENINIEIDLMLCVWVDIGMETRSCEMRSGPACIDSCSFAAVAPGCLAELGGRARPRDMAVCQAERVELCRSQCDFGGAAFCDAAGRGGGHERWDDDDNEWDDDEVNVFVNIDVCVDLEIKVEG
ncbi:hypothetical protein [Nannocystis radixulma]|uniref:Uncharacterized protein n=1 Tax=Nannocystis radixulma TaxID=2995305 RepID=A0ABT5B9M1_9BACT|nr:hypothetical protein [Nannocystis radixulma]MDC0670835.1 hypothetical protein [Nannocystis radixulma]